MESRKLRSTRLTIYHERIPYTAVPATPTHEEGLFCIVELTGGFFRVLHIGSGITLTDTKGVTAALRFVKDATKLYHRAAEFRAALEDVSWSRYCRFQKGVCEPACEVVFRLLEPFSAKQHNVSKNTTKNEKYLYPSEPIY